MLPSTLGLIRGCLQLSISCLPPLQDYFLLQDCFQNIQVHKSTQCLFKLLLHSSRLLLLLLLLLQGLQALQGSLLGLFLDPMDLPLQGPQFHRLLEGPLLELLLGPMVLLHKALQDLGLLHCQVLHHPDLVLVAEFVLLVVPLPYPTLLLDLQGGPQEACSLTPEDSLALFPVQGSTSPMTCWLRPTLLLDLALR